VHVASRGTYDAALVYAEMRLGHGIIVGHNAVELLMRRAGIKVLPTHKYRRPLHRIPTASDFVNGPSGAFTMPALAAGVLEVGPSNCPPQTAPVLFT
jgi:hypothetical protein